MKYLIALLALVSCALGQNNTGVLMIDTLRPKGSADTFPIVLGNEVRGGPFSVSNTAAMSNIPSARLVPGALAYVTNDSIFRMWDGSAWVTNKLRTALGIPLADTSNVVRFDPVTGNILLPTNGPVDDVTWLNSNMFMRNVTAEGITVSYQGSQFFYAGDDMVEVNVPMVVSNSAGIEFAGSNAISSTRANLGFSAALNNLWTATNAASARNALDIGSVVVGGGTVDLASTNATGILPLAKGGTGATNVGQARTNLGATSIGSALFTASTSTAARQALGLQSYTNSLSADLTTLEIGQSYTNVSITWLIAPTNASYAVRQLISSNAAGTLFTNALTTNSGTAQFAFTPAITNDRVWTLTVGDGLGVTNTATTSISFLNYMIWGRSSNTTLSNAAIQTLHTNGGNRVFATSRNRSFSMDGGGQYIFIAYPAGFGSASFTVGGLPNTAFTLTTNSYTNASGYVTNYLIYRTDTVQNGTGINFVVQ